LLRFNFFNAIFLWICRALAHDTGKANSYQLPVPGAAAILGLSGVIFARRRRYLVGVGS